MMGGPTAAGLAAVGLTASNLNDSGTEITAGLGGFLVLFFLAIAVIFLGRDLAKRLRRLDHQEQLRLEEERLKSERREQLQAQSEATPEDPADGTTND